MASDITSFLLVTGDLIVAAILLYGAYWAFAIRQALSGRIYRAQALWAGVLCPAIIPYTAGGLFPNSSIIPLIELGIVSYYIFFIVFLFLWIDTSVRVSRYSDPLLRDTFSWKRLRIVLWGVMVSALTLIYAYVIGTSFLGLTIPQELFFSFQGVLYIPPLAIGGPAIITAGIRSRDSALRKSLKWFGLFILAFLAPGSLYFLSLFVKGIFQGSIVAISGFVFIPMAYCLYRCVRSLVPINRLLLSE